MAAFPLSQNAEGKRSATISSRTQFPQLWRRSGGVSAERWLFPTPVLLFTQLDAGPVQGGIVSLADFRVRPDGKGPS